MEPLVPLEGGIIREPSVPLKGGIIREPSVPLELSALEFLDIEQTVVEMVDEYIQNNVLQMADPDFHEQMTNTIAEILFAQWSDAGLCLDEDFEDIITFVERFADHYFDNYLGVDPALIPPVRSHRTTLILDKNDNAVDIGAMTWVDRMTKKIEDLAAVEQPAQRTPEWYAFRNELITASNLGKIFMSEAQ